MTYRLVLGKRDAAYGLWVSKRGFNVLTTSDENMLFSMEKLGQAYITGNFTFGGASTQTVTVRHGLGFKPVLLFRDAYDGSYGGYLKVTINTGNILFRKIVGVSFGVSYVIYNKKWRN